jgi:hypothetical protein
MRWPAMPPTMDSRSMPVPLRADGECQREYPARISSLYAYAPRRNSVAAFSTRATSASLCGPELAGRQPQPPIPATRSTSRAHLPALAIPASYDIRPSLHGQPWTARADVPKCRRARQCVARQSGRILRYRDLPKRGVLRQKIPTGISLLTDKDISEPCYRSPAAGRR